MTCRDTGRGRAYWFNTRLGALRPESTPVTVVSEFFARWLRDGGIEPGYLHTTAAPDQLRVEQPMMTTNGDTAQIVAGTTCVPVPAGRLSVRLPAGTKTKHAFWAPAGQVMLRAPGDWNTAPNILDTPELAPGELREFTFPVTPPQKSANYEFGTEGLDFLRSDNVSDNRFPRDLRLWTGATCHYLPPEKVKDSGSGLTDGLDRWNRRVQFHSGAEVVFDLRKTYRLTGIRLRRAVAPYPAGVEITVSEDGKEFRPAVEADTIPWDDGGWTEIKFNPEKARFIRVQLRFAGGKGGWLEELEVYGRP